MYKQRVAATSFNTALNLDIVWVGLPYNANFQSCVGSHIPKKNGHTKFVVAGNKIIAEQNGRGPRRELGSGRVVTKATLVRSADSGMVGGLVRCCHAARAKNPRLSLKTEKTTCGRKGKVRGEVQRKGILRKVDTLQFFGGTHLAFW